MKKIFTAILFLCLTYLSMSLVYAASYSVPAGYPPPVDRSEFAIGGISIGTSMDEIKQIYGEPDKIELQPNNPAFEDVEIWTYGKSFIINLNRATDGGKTPYLIRTNANNGLKTPSGFTVGQNIGVVTSHFQKQGVRMQYRQWKGVGYYSVSLRGAIYIGMTFTVDKNGKITEISIHEDA